MVKRQPGRYLLTRKEPLLLTFAIDGDHDSGTATTDDLGITVQRRTWMDRIYRPLLLPVHVELDQSDWNIPLFGDRYPFQLSVTLLGAYSLVLIRSFASIATITFRTGLRRPDRWDTQDITWAVIGATVAMMTVGSALIEFGENGRFRAALDPLVVALALHTLVRGARWCFSGRDRPGHQSNGSTADPSEEAIGLHSSRMPATAGPQVRVGEMMGVASPDPRRRRVGRSGQSS